VTPTHVVQVVKSMMVFWTAGFVLLTLGINAPMLPFILRITGLSKVRSAAMSLCFLMVLACTHALFGEKCLWLKRGEHASQ
jgi:hypothetical protein